jgi:hypothetical protein
MISHFRATVACRCTAAVLLSLASANPAGAQDRESKTIELFNGKDLKGWSGHEKYWSVKNGVIVGKNSEPVKVSTYLVTDEEYGDFRLLATVKLVRSEMHSGLALWGRLAPEKGDKYTYGGLLVMFPSDWGLYDLYGRNGIGDVSGEPAKKIGKQHDWNELEILARGNRLRVAANGVEIMDWTDPQRTDAKAGPIGLQLHSNNEPQEVHFKNLKLTTFPDDRLITLKKK